MDLTEEDVYHILRIIDTLDYGDIQLQYGDLKISIQRGNAQPANIISPSESLRQEAPGTASEFEKVSQPPLPVLTDEGYHAVCSPVDGIFFSAPSPGASPFVEVGSTVEPEDSVCLVEVMKLFNSVPAGIRGRVVDVRVANGQPVQREQILMGIAPVSE